MDEGGFAGCVVYASAYCSHRVGDTYHIYADCGRDAGSEQGRFGRKRQIPLPEITSVQQCASMRFGRFALTRYVLIGYGKGKYEAVMPVKEREFMQLLEARLSGLSSGGVRP